MKVRPAWAIISPENDWTHAYIYNTYIEARSCRWLFGPSSKVVRIEVRFPDKKKLMKK